MDPQIDELYGPLHQMKFNDQRRPILSNENFVNVLKPPNTNWNSPFGNPTVITTNPNFDLVVPSLGPNVEGALHEDYDFSDVVLKYINEVLMEEDEGEKIHLGHEPLALEAAEKSLYEVLGQSHSPQNQYSPEEKRDDLSESGIRSCVSYSCDGASSGSGIVEHSWSSYPPEYNPMQMADFPVLPSKPLLTTSDSSSNSLTGNGNGLVDRPADSPVSALSVSDIFNDSQSVIQFQKGMEEASKFLPKASLCLDLNAGPCPWESVNKARGGLILVETSHENEVAVLASRGKKHRHPEELRSEVGRGSKQPAVFQFSDEAVVRSEMFDRVLLCSGGKNDADLRQALQSELNKTMRNAQMKGSNGGKGRGRKQVGRRDVVDLRSLLSLCAQAVGSHDQRRANDLIRQIRKHSSPTGDGNQRMAHYFADGLEARLAGVGTPIYNSLVTGPASAIDILRAYHMFLATCPFKKIGNFFSNRTIMDVAQKANRLHIIDLGIVYGFQWPCLIQRLSSRPGGPPKLRITGVDLPQPGFRPAKRVEETGQRLRNYAESFNVPFEFNAIAKSWETLTVKDLKIDPDEVLVVNCLFRFKYIPEETVIAECPRDIVLNLIRQIKPAVFIHGVVNGAFNSPFFIARFREALFHFSTLFDVLEANLPRDIEERILIERDIFGRQAMNVIACEGLERIERPETYKQWQVRNERAGLKQLPLNQETVEMAKKQVTAVYHKDFSIDEDGHWLLQGWKGRIVYALTTWKPAE